MTTTQTFSTNLRCSSCIASITPGMESIPGLTGWAVDLASSDKLLTVHGNVSPEAVRAALAKSGYKAQEIPQPKETVITPAPETVQATSSHEGEVRSTYFPLVLLVAFLVGVVGFAEIRSGSFEWSRAMTNFMGGFFLAFSFFKLLDIRGFADAYAGYDIVARRFRFYGFVYPFIELALGAAYLTGFESVLTNLATLIVMSVSSIGVLQSVLNKRAIRCACLGTVFNLPMSTVTLVEDGTMVAMAAAALAFGTH